MGQDTKESILTNLCQKTFKAEYIDQINVGEGRGRFEKIVKLNLKNSDGVITCKFSGRNDIHESKDYASICIIGFRNIKPPMIAKLLEDNQYNYEIVEKAINQFFNLGEKYKLFKSLKPIKNLKIEETLSNVYRWDSEDQNTFYAYEKTISNIQFSNFYKTENHKSTFRPKKLKGKNMTLYYRFVLRNGEIHPIAKMDYPVAPNVSIPIEFDIHPNAIEESNEKFAKYYNELDERLNKRVNQILKKELKLTTKDIAELSMDDKINYLIISEMSVI